MKICFISDTHNQHPELPNADLLIHCGDLTGSGSLVSFVKEVNWLKSIKHQFPLGIILIPGNHDFGLDNELRGAVLAIFKDADIEVIINRPFQVMDIKFFGSPMTPIFNDWAFMADEDTLAQHWRSIREDTQILITHGPPQGIRDLCKDGHVGSSSLRYHLDNNLPELKVHAFGHIHEGAGYDLGPRYISLNASVLDGQYKGFNPIHIVDTDTWTIT